jgi:hypothetical protein
VITTGGTAVIPDLDRITKFAAVPRFTGTLASAAGVVTSVGLASNSVSPVALVQAPVPAMESSSAAVPRQRGVDVEWMVKIFYPG